MRLPSHFGAALLADGELFRFDRAMHGCYRRDAFQGRSPRELGVQLIDCLTQRLRSCLILEVACGFFAHNH